MKEEPVGARRRACGCPPIEELRCGDADKKLPRRGIAQQVGQTVNPRNRRPDSRPRVSVSFVALALAIAAILVVTDRPLLEMTFGDPPAGEAVITTDPSPFPETLIGVPFEFQVTLVLEENTRDVHLSLRAACPSGGAALLSGDAMGNACLGPIETSSQDLGPGSTSWAFTVVYQGSTGTYRWTIEAHGDEEDDDDCGPGFWKNHEELWDGGADDVTATYETTHTFNAEFDVSTARSGLGDDMTLLGALDVAGGKLMALNRHAAAALLNADSTDYPLSVGDVIALYQDAVGAVIGPETVSSALEILTTNNHQSDCEFDD